jgi:spore maturation protein CgeB
VEEFFLSVAARLPDRSFLLGGSGWQTKELPRNVRLAGHVGTKDHNAFFCSAAAVLNVNRESMARYGFSPPTRIFEAAGAGACIISDAWAGIEHFLEPEKEILVAHDGAKVAEALVDLDPLKRQRLAKAARARVLAHHTYARRAQQVNALLGLSAKCEVAA